MISDEILSLLFTKTQFQKLVIFYELYSREIHYSEIEERLGDSKRGVRRAVESLTLDIEEFNVEKNITLQILSNKEKLFFSSPINDDEYINLKNFLQEKYLQTSGLYNSLLYVLERRKFSLISLTNFLSYSESYVYKLMKKINKFFEMINLGIKISKGIESKYIIEGDEGTIRMLHYFLINIALTENTWKFRTIDEKQINLINSAVKSERTDYLSPSNIKRVYIMIAIHEIAIKGGNRIQALPDSLRDIGRIMNKEREISTYINNQHQRKLGNADYLQNEIVRLAFILNYFSQELRTKQEKICIGKELFDNKKNSIVNPCIKLLEDLMKSYNFEKDLYYSLLYSLCNRLVVIHYLGVFKFLTLNDSPIKFENIEKNVQNLIEKHLKDYKEEASFPYICQSFKQLLLSYIKLSKDSALNIYIEIQNRPEYKVILENELKLNYNNKILKIVEDFSEADVVVADTHIQTNSKFFYFRDIYDQESWLSLTKFIDTNLKIIGTN